MHCYCGSQLTNSRFGVAVGVANRKIHEFHGWEASSTAHGTIAAGATWATTTVAVALLIAELTTTLTTMMTTRADDNDGEKCGDDDDDGDDGDDDGHEKDDDGDDDDDHADDEDDDGDDDDDSDEGDGTTRATTTSPFRILEFHAGLPGGAAGSGGGRWAPHFEFSNMN